MYPSLLGTPARCSVRPPLPAILSKFTVLHQTWWKASPFHQTWWKGTPPFKHIINDLIADTKYYIRIAAVNSVAVQAVDPSGNPPDNTNWAGPFSNTPKDAGPNAPGSVKLSMRSGTSLLVTVKEPTRNGGQALGDYKIEYATTADFAVNLCVSASCVKAAPAASDMLDGSAVFYFDGLTAGTNYYARVSAKNSIGYDPPKTADDPLAPVRSPDAPSKSDLTTVSVQDSPISHLTVAWTAPSVTGGSQITKYKVEWWAIERDDKAMRIKEVQVVTIKWAAAMLLQTWTPLSFSYFSYFSLSLSLSVSLSVSLSIFLLFLSLSVP